MDSISTDLRPSAYVGEPHRQILVYGRPIDLVLSDLAPNEDLRGLVPAFEFLLDEHERSIANPRLFDLKPGTHLVPLLICPDDLDFSCTVVIVEVIIHSSAVTWSRIGRDATNSADPTQVGFNVSWFDNIPAFTFALQQYRNALQSLSSSTTTAE